VQCPNTLDLRIFNLSQSTANLVHSPEFTNITVQAGYEGNFGIIFKGSIKQVRLGRIDQKDSYVDITAADGDEAYGFAIVNKSLAARATSSGLAAVLLGAMQRFGVTKGYQPTFVNNGNFRGCVLYGLARDELRDFAENNECAWSIQDGALTFIPLTSYIPGDVPLITATTGLIGVPEQTAGGIQMRMLLNPNIKLGQCVKLETNALNAYRYGLDLESQKTSFALAMQIKTNADGLYYCMNVSHHGDLRGEAWWTDIVCLAVDATVIKIDALSALTSAPAGSIPRFP
jgi:hypothetical protein